MYYRRFTLSVQIFQTMNIKFESRIAERERERVKKRELKRINIIYKRIKKKKVYGIMD